MRSSAPTLPMPVIYTPTLCLVAQGTKEARLRDTVYRYDAASYLIASVELPVMGSVIEATASRPYLCLQIDLNLPDLTEMLIQHSIPATRAHSSPAGISLNRMTPALLEAAVRLVKLLDEPETIDALAPLTVREILYRLLTGPGGEMIRQMAQAESQLNKVSRAIIWIRTHFNQPCRIEQAAAIAGMSRSTFHHHFRRITRLTPLEFRTQLRLQEARRLMVSEAMDAASAGFSVGYDSPSQFSRDYVREFGVPPARHASQLRQNPGWTL